MAELLKVYKCEKCGNIVEVLHDGPGALICCGEEMKVYEEKTADSSTEKHVPYIEKKDNGYLVKVGKETSHPMDEKHYIEWIELLADGVAYRKFLKPGDKPEAFFELNATNVYAKELCNIHGVWKGEL
jgi:superoxide reductase